MKPVYQTIVEAGRGDCFSAAIASLLELPLDCVPNFRALDSPKAGMMKLARVWLMRHFGLSLVTIQMQNDNWENVDVMPIIGASDKTPCIAGGKSPNLRDCNHAVVGEIDGLGNFTMSHDPNPSGKGIIGNPTHLYFLIQMNNSVSRLKDLSKYKIESLNIEEWFRQDFSTLKSELR